MSGLRFDTAADMPAGMKSLYEKQSAGGGAQAPPPPAQNKYHNERANRGALRFDSKKEARRFDELLALAEAGKVRELKLQPQFTLQEAYTTTEGIRVRAIRYQADFSYERATEPEVMGTVHWLPTVEDVKSQATKTRVYGIKKKLMREKFGITISEV